MDLRGDVNDADSGGFMDDLSDTISRSPSRPGVVLVSFLPGGDWKSLACRRVFLLGVFWMLITSGTSFIGVERIFVI